MLHPNTLPLVRAFQAAGLRVWLIGGNAVELLLGPGTDLRPHDDIDFFVREAHGERAVAVLEALGFIHAHGSLAAGDVFYRRGAVLVDLVPIRDHLDPPQTVGELSQVAWPPGLLAPFAVARDGVTVPMLTPAMQRAMKDVVAGFYGLEFREKDRVDVAALEKWEPHPSAGR